MPEESNKKGTRLQLLEAMVEDLDGQIKGTHDAFKKRTAELDAKIEKLKREIADRKRPQ